MSTVLTYLSFLSIFFPLIAGIFYYAQLEQLLKTFTLFIIISALFDTTLTVTTAYRVPNLPLTHLFLLVNLSFFCYIYYALLSAKWAQYGLLVLASTTALLVIANALLWGGLAHFPSLPLTLQSILLTCLALLYYYQMLTQQKILHIEKHPWFWINTGVLIYFSGNIFLFMLRNRMMDAHATDYSAYWAIHSVLNIIANTLFGIGLLCKKT
ncbi:hypothetical protein SAMN05421823_104320 [Catalinimonas alkaloidigena]|uniref:YhhN-like protein n=1 Tax=Catalinimonas alkaloidigena TaxID=1075417 RepID=A0A1G9H4T0_9BACT|nr:hypothetical protein [Catalinimonas alkaloidigena]SDL08018.1 hypothetical protein SAMN05421823_104320 [Catalinimonas alkaloidigena]